jgi:hypothetical protein
MSTTQTPYTADECRAYDEGREAQRTRPRLL